ncbi:hypothetical protein [Leptolyngbya sp. 7M]|uniref:hypothetical protein n=1 Tax=Leptolyngbya sp. 7M TaxID=2812896 RepID=UPI001B8C2E0B|nr:hypothetical protein [Leptolyngbya sp. 7M]QYO62306.1 hypothetical protein JVX88_19635 [Leptolyngbya sp. 7M]
MAILELQSTRLSWVNLVETATAKDVLEAIQERAQERWGEKWIAELVKAYVKIAIANGDEGATVVKRRSQIERALKSGSCTLDTAIWLAAAVGCRFQMVCMKVEVREF